MQNTSTEFVQNLLHLISTVEDNVTITTIVEKDRAVGGPKYMASHTAVSAVYLAISGTAIVTGCLGNLLVLSAILTYRPLHHVRNTFVFNLAVADLTVTSFADPMGVLGLVYGSQWFTQRMILCDVVATFCLIACVTALLSIGGDGFSRYCYICHHDLSRRVFTLRNSILLCLSFWVFGAGMALPPLVGWTYNVYDEKYLECIWNRKYSFSYTIFFSTCVVILPASIIAISYIKIFLHVRASQKRLSLANGVKQPCTKTVKLAKSLFIVFMSFVLCWTPFAIMIVADFEDKVMPEIHLFVLLLAHMHSTLNSIIYALTNQQFRRGYICILLRICPCLPKGFKNKIYPSHILNDTVSHTYQNTISTSDMISVRMGTFHAPSVYSTSRQSTQCGMLSPTMMIDRCRTQAIPSTK